MIAVATLIIIILLSLLITRVATMMLTLTGLSKESARFQARSALSGVGFTTAEAEAVVNHPVRRRIVMTLMLLGSAGVITVIGALFLSFANADLKERELRLLVLIVALGLLVLLSRSSWVDRRLSALIGRGLNRWTDLEVRDYAALLRLADRFAVMELAVGEGDWLAGKSLEQLELRKEGVVVLGISRAAGRYVGVPSFDTRIEAGDVAICYGHSDRLCELDGRPAGPQGDRAHAAAVVERKRLAS
ncbi:MAG TPA: TrkA C-terminal domain-containing protein [Solirubrobacterales bacterium]